MIKKIYLYKSRGRLQGFYFNSLEFFLDVPNLENN